MVESPPICSKRLRISPFREEFLSPRYVGWLNDPDIVRYSEQRHRVHTLESCRAYWASFKDSPNHFWAVEEVGEHLGHIGNMTAYVDEDNLVADVGILIGEKTLHGRGYGLEAWQAVCRFLLENRGMRKLCAGTLSVNEAMLKIMKRAGMIEDGRRIRHYLFQNREVDIVYMALFR